MAGLQGASGAQDSIKDNILYTKGVYETILRAALLKAPGNGTNIVQLADASFLSVGDTVYIYAEDQEELLRGVKAINGFAVTLNDVVPSKYRPIDKARLYKLL